MGTSRSTWSRATRFAGSGVGVVVALLALAACAGEDDAVGDTGSTGGAGAGDDGGAGGGGDGGGGSDGTGGPSTGVAGGAPGTSCVDDGGCDDGDPCTTDVCDRATSGEFTTGACAWLPVDGCGDPPVDDPGDDDPGDDGPGDAVDPTCAESGGGEAVFLPYEPLGEPEVPASCDEGIEWQNCTSTFDLSTIDGEGIAARTLIVDLATYTAPDWLRIVAVTEGGAETIVLDTCRVRTAEYPDPTDGASRPPDETLRRFEVEVPAGTAVLRLDASNAGTPFYMRVLGVCGFTLAGPASCAFRTATP